MTDELRNTLRGMADGAAARTPDLDTGRLVEFVGAARRRRDRRQKATVGGLALAMVGGLTFGGYQLLGVSDDDGGLVAGPEREVSSVFPGPEDAQCGDVFPLLEHADDIEPRLVGANFLIDIEPDERGLEYGHRYSGIGLSLDDVSGQTYRSVPWLLNPENGEHIAGGSSGTVNSVVVRDGRVVGTYGGMRLPYVPFNLDPGYAIQLNTGGTGECEAFGDGYLNTDEIYYVLEADGINSASSTRSTRVWGGPWTYGEILP